MRQIIESLQARISDRTPYTAYFGNVPEAPTYPYVLLWSSAGGLETNVLGGVRDLAEPLGVTMVATTPIGTLAMGPHVRDAIVGFVPTSHLWRVDDFRPPYDSRTVQLDRDVILPGRGHPAFAVDMYDLTGTPLPPAPPVAA